MSTGARGSLALAIFVVSGSVAGTWACGSLTGLPENEPPTGGHSLEAGQDGPVGVQDSEPDGQPSFDGPEDSPSFQDGTSFQDSISFEDVVTFEDAPFDGSFDSPPPFDGPFDGPFDEFPFFDSPVEDAPISWTGGPPVAVATAEQPVNLALDGTYVYWENSSGSVVDCPLGGCPSNSPTLLTLGDTEFQGEQTLATGFGSGFFVDEAGGISFCNGAGCKNSPTSFVEGDGEGGTFDGGFGSYNCLVTDPSNLYFTDGVSIYSCPFGSFCGSPTVLGTSSGATLGPLGLSSTEVYFADDGSFSAGIRAVSIESGTQRRVCTSPLAASVVSLVVTPEFVYFTTNDDPSSIYQCASGGGSAPTVFASDASPSGLAADGSALYWTNNIPDGAVVTCGLGSTCVSPKSVATNQDTPSAVAVDDANVYWTTNTAVYRASKP